MKVTPSPDLIKRVGEVEAHKAADIANAIVDRVNQQELEKHLLMVSEINYRVDRLFEMGGTAAATPVRIVEIAADAILSGLDGFNIEQFHVCPGYGGNHVWAMRNHVPTVGCQIVERCDSHPERRSSERRRR